MGDFTASERKLFFSKNDADDPRLGELAKSSLDGVEVVILGYPDDEGIEKNGGRRGAAEGPVHIRQALYKTTPHARRKTKTFADAGDLKISGELKSRHETARGFVRDLLKKKTQVLSLGGGNDYAYADGMAFLDVCAGEKPLIINVDAHLDVRDMGRGINSGTPFFRLLESEFKFDFVELGIQGQCNARAHWDYVEKKGGQIISHDEILDSGRSLLDFTVAALGEKLLRKRPAFLAIDIDAFAWPYAAGSSAAWPIGLQPQDFWPLFQLFMKRLDVRVLGIYEVSPPLESAGGTVKLAAQLAHGFLHHV